MSVLFCDTQLSNLLGIWQGSRIGCLGVSDDHSILVLTTTLRPGDVCMSGT